MVYSFVASPAAGPKMKYYVFNPMSNKFDVITTDDTSWVHDMCLVFDPTKSRNYKVIAVQIPNSETRSWRIDVYSSGTGSWFHTGVCASVSDRFFLFERGVYWKCAVHWISMEIDIDRQVLLELLLPSWLMKCRHKEFTYFGESNDHLLLAASDFHFLPPQFDVYELEKDYSGWFVKFKDDFSSFGVRFPGFVTCNRHHMTMVISYHHFFLLRLFWGKRMQSQFLVFNDRGKIKRYDFVSGTSSEIQSCRPGRRVHMKFGDTLKFNDNIIAYPFYECLSCVL